MSFLTSVEQGWKLLIGLGAGTGLVFILRWYWWRVNAWSEISAMIASFITSVVLAFSDYDLSNPASATYAKTMLITVLVTTVVWLTVTLNTAPESTATLDRFYRKVRPGGAGWRTVSRRLGFGDEPIPGGALSWVNWAAGVAAVYCAVFAVGAFLTGSRMAGGAYAVIAIVSFALIQRNLRRDPQLSAALTGPEPVT
jgi:SSS family solute:Na+ symporter